MKPVVKGLLIGCVALVVLAIAAIVAGILYVRSNKDRFIAEGNKVREEAQAFGRSATESGCVAEALSRYKSDSSFKGQIHARLWLTGCLEAAPRDSAFCTNVPPKSEFTRTVNWRIRECTRLGFESDSGCHNILTAVQDHCEGKKARS